MRHIERDPEEIETETRQSDDAAAVVETRIPGLTVLYHPDLGRVGERAPLAELGAGSVCSLSRLEPGFAVPGQGERRALGDPSISRQPVLQLTPAAPPGAIVLSSLQPRTRVTADGRRLDHERTVTVEELERGVVLEIGRRIVLLLHLLDPLSAMAPEVDGLIGESPQMACVRRQIAQVADLDVAVLLRGETGTGKELVARAVHRRGPRRAGPFVAVNMAAIPESLAAAELFGATRGAYTGAHRGRPGFFQRADGGTLFLDEIGDTPSGIQALLLRALESGEVQPVGAERSQRLDVRIVSATDRDLEAAMRAAAFRSPLLFRLGAFTLQLPPLRARREDFGRLFAAFLVAELDTVGASDRLAPAGEPWVPASLVARLARYAWPGNVRQLANTVRQLIVAHRDSERVPANLPLETLVGPCAEPLVEREDRPARPDVPARALPRRRRPVDVHEDELVGTLRANRWRLQDTACQLGIPRSSLYRLIERSTRVRKATDLSQAEIERCAEETGGSIARMADALEVSERALLRRMGRLGLRCGFGA